MALECPLDCNDESFSMLYLMIPPNIGLMSVHQKIWYPYTKMQKAILSPIDQPKRCTALHNTTTNSVTKAGSLKFKINPPSRNAVTKA